MQLLSMEYKYGNHPQIPLPQSSPGPQPCSPRSPSSLLLQLRLSLSPLWHTQYPSLRLVTRFQLWLLGIPFHRATTPTIPGVTAYGSGLKQMMLPWTLLARTLEQLLNPKAPLPLSHSSKEKLRLPVLRRQTARMQKTFPLTAITSPYGAASVSLIFILTRFI